MGRRIRVAYRGNFGVSFSTESHVAASLEELGHQVVRIQENECSWMHTLRMTEDCDMFLWTSTHDYAAMWDRGDAESGLALLGDRMPTVALHLDLWWELKRARQVSDEPYFRCRYVFTADGDHDAEFAAAGVNHIWSPPAVFGPECIPGTFRPEFASDIAFVGNWHKSGGYHKEWFPKRKALLDAVSRRYGNRMKFWPEAGKPTVREQALNDLYASTKIIIGDSCFADGRARRYVSDRPFETVGRGGFLLMPHIEALTEMLVDGEHCRYFNHGDHAFLFDLIDHYLEADDEREAIRAAGQAHVRDHHTYAHRLAAVIDRAVPEDVAA